jgi:diguanylate cyclase (GGDEF)-like protein
MTFFFTDAVWGFFDEYHLMTLLAIDTVIFFIAMNLSVILWGIFVAIYINKNKKMNFILFFGGLTIFIYLIVMSIINLFKPVLFTFDGYTFVPLFGRYLLYVFQIILFAVVSVISLIFYFTDKTKIRKRCLAIGLFGFIMAFSIIGQLHFALLPFYSMGCIISICLMHVFVVSAEKDELTNDLKNALNKEKSTVQELNLTRKLVYVDSLTGAKSKHAFVEIETKIDELIASQNIDLFAIIVFDINGLKNVNDTKGHEAGDEYIKDSYHIIKEVYQNTEIYRFGGDEFVAVLEGIDFENREILFKKFNDIIDSNLSTEKPIVSIGMDDYNKKSDNTFNAVFVRADKNMYVRKNYLKSLGATSR